MFANKAKVTMNEWNDENILAKVKAIFTEYLKKHNLRKTPERYAILETVYSIDGHFDVETLYDKVNGSKYRICRATLYNTMELLLGCNLIIEYTFGKRKSQYECSYKCKQHGHFVDLDSGEVTEFADPRIRQIQKSVEETLGVDVSHHSFTFYGYKRKK